MSCLFCCISAAAVQAVTAGEPAPISAQAAPVHSVTAETTHISEKAVTQQFHLKPGDLFSEHEYEIARRDLENTRLFRSLDFIYKEREDGVDIHIKADGRRYVLPMFFGLSGNKHAVGVSVGAGNLWQQGEYASLFVGGGRDGLDVHGGVNWRTHSVSAGYTHLNFTQRFYRNGWMSSPGIFSTADDKDKYAAYWLGEIHGREDDFFVSYAYQFSSVWSVFVTPEYEYYNYQYHALDSGNHSHISFGLSYADHISSVMNMRGIDGAEHLHKDEMLRDLPAVRRGKTAQIGYTAGGAWSGSDYDISKIAVGGEYLWELKAHHVLALFAKAQRAFAAPFSSQIESSDLLFNVGIYDREQRGKGGVSAGISFTYFLLRNKTGLLSVAPFYEQAFITSGGNSYQSHSGVGVTLSARLWCIPLPVSLNFTHNLDAGNQHVGCKVGGRF